MCLTHPISISKADSHANIFLPLYHIIIHESGGDTHANKKFTDQVHGVIGTILKSKLNTESTVGQKISCPTVLLSIFVALQLSLTVSVYLAAVHFGTLGESAVGLENLVYFFSTGSQTSQR